MTSGLKLTLGAAVLASGIGYLAYAGAASSWQYYLSVDEAVEDGARLNGKRVRVSGRVVAGSLAVGEDRRQATFDLAGELHTMHVTCRCSLPDNLAEDIDVVVEGTLQADGIHGQKVITRCASKYEAQNRLPMKNNEASTAHGVNAAKSPKMIAVKSSQWRQMPEFLPLDDRRSDGDHNHLWRAQKRDL